MNRKLALAAAGLAGAGLFARTRVRAATHAHPPHGRFLHAGGVRLHYIDGGFGTPVVMLHGLGSMVEDFELSGLFGRAAEQYRVVAFDRPGYGYSERPRGARSPLAQARVLHAAFEKLGIARPVIVAHSWATLVALAYALEYPGKLRGLVLASGYYFPTVRADAPLLVPPGIPIIGALLRYTLSPLMGRLLWPAWLRLIFAPLPVPGYFARFPTWRALAAEQLRAVGEESAMLLPAVIALGRQYRKVEARTVIVAGEGDRYVRAARHSGRLHQLLPNSSYRAVAGAGHMVHHADPQAIVQAIEEVA